MSWIRCPECNAKISDAALCCPRCGFTADKPLLPISKQVSTEAVPPFFCETGSGNTFETVLLNAVTIENRLELSDTFGNMAWLGLHVPEIAEAICNLARNEGNLVADLSPFLRKMIATGRYSFNIDSASQILPTIRDSSGKIIRQVRLKPADLNGIGTIADLCGSIGTHLAMAQMMQGMERMNLSIQNIHAEIQQDRLSKFEAARDMFMRAQKMDDPSLREQFLLATVQTATEAKHSLMWNFTQNLQQVKSASQKSISQMVFAPLTQSGISTNARDAFNDLSYATASCQLECFAYVSLGEKEAAADCIDAFADFLLENQLLEDDTLVMLHENLGRSEKSAKMLAQWQDTMYDFYHFGEQNLLTNSESLEELEEE